MTSELSLRDTIENLVNARGRYSDVNRADPSQPLEIGSSADPPEEGTIGAVVDMLGLGQLPPDLETLWNHYGEVRLFLDLTYGQWGVTIWPPSVAIDRTREGRYLFGDRFRTDDLIIGGFRGDTDLFVMPTNRDEADWGHVLVANPVDDRGEWYDAARSLAEFVVSLADANGEKYWALRPATDP